MPREFTPEELGIQQKEFTPEELGIIKPSTPIVSAKKPEDEGFFHGIYESGKQGIESFKDIASGYGLGASKLFESPEETKKKMDAIKAEAAKPNDFNQLSFADLERIKKDKGLLSAIEQVPKYAAEALAGSAPQSAVPLAVGSAATALALPVTGPFAPVIGAIAGMGAYGLQQLGSNLNVQGKVRERPEDINVGKAVTASAIQAPLGYLADRFTLGLGGVGSKGIIAIGTELAARKAAGELGALGVARGVASQAVKGASQGFIAEAPTEALEQVLERWQAGQPLLDDEAKQAYKEAFFSAGASGGLGGAASRGIETYSAFKQPEENITLPSSGTKTTNLPSKEEQIQHEIEQDTHLNPFGNVHQEEINPDLTDIIQQDRELNNKPHLKSYSLGDIADALLQTNEPNTHLDDILTKKISDLTQEAPEIVEQKASLQTPEAVTALATSKGIDTASQGYNDFLERSTGATDLSVMSPMQLHAAHTAISQVTNPELPEGTNAKRFTNDQYQAAISTLPPQTEITSVIPHIVSTGVSLPEAKAIEAHAFKMGDLEVEGNTVSPAGVSSVFGERPDIRYQPFKQSTVPTAFEVNGKTYNTEEEALQEQQVLEKARLSELALAKKGISSTEKEIARHVAEKEKQDVALATMRLNGKDVGHPQYDFYKKAIADVVNKKADNYIAPLQAQLEKHQANLERHQNPVEITPLGEQPIYQDRHVLYGRDEQGTEVPVASFDTRQEAEKHVINQQNKDTLQELINSTDTGSQVERLKQLAQARIQELQGEAPTGGFTPEAQAKVDAIQKTLIPQLQKFGLNNVGVRIVNSINNGTADGEYVNKLINIAYDAENPMGTLRHETIHALKELGAFTDKEWAILKKKAQDEWIQTYIINENLFEAYQNAHLKQVGSMKGFEEMIEEEAIAEAFKHFAVGKKPSGIIGNIFHRISKLFEAIRRAFIGQGFDSPDKIFQGIEEGKYAGRTEGQGQSKYSFIRKAVPNESEISTQNPTGQNRPYNPITDMLSIDEASVREAMEANPELRQRVINAIRGYGFIPANIAEEDVIPTFKRNIVNNLLFLYNKVPPEIRARSKLWYDGANRIANDLANVYDISPEQVSGILAAMSPQKDWFQNVSMAERAIDILTKRGEMSWTPEMLQYAESYINETDKREIKEKRRREFENIISPSADNQIKLKDMDETSAAAFIRAYDEAFNSRDYRIVTPEGGFAGLVTKNDGTPATMMWSTYGPIKKTVSIFRKPSRTNISNKLGTEHKIRSFYNNIVAPNSDISHVTMDTHAVAAALFEALAGTDIPVAHNFGGTGKNKNLGVGGTYGIIADAYREAAKQVGIKPRELQSITWEAVRGLFNEDIKTTLQKKIPAEWDKYKQGLVSFDDARNTILGLAQTAVNRNITDNITEPDWVGSGRGDYVSEGGASYDKSFVPEGGVRLRKESEIRENLKINLSAASKSIPGLNELYNLANKGDTEAYELLQKVAEARLKFLVGKNAKVVVEYSENVSDKNREPSINATVSFKESNSKPVLAALAQFADSFNQEQIHVRQKTAFPFMHDFNDGSYATAVYKIELNESLSDKEISNIISKSGLNGFNLTKKTLTAYWVDPKEKSNEDFLRFKDQIIRVVELVGNATKRPKPAIERLTIYGKGGQRELSSIRGDILPAQASDTVTPKLIAQFLNKQPVTTFKQKDLTKSELLEQRALAKVFEDLPTNDLKNPLVIRAYHALTKALVEQYKVLPIKVNVMANVGIDGKVYAYGGRDTTALKKALTKGLTSAQADEAIQYLKDHYGIPNPKWDSGILSTIKPFENDPYGNLSSRVREDVSKNNQLMVYKTSPATFGPNKSSFKSHPLLKKSGLLDVNGYPMLYNDILRAVHDYYAHNLSDATFGAKGEFAAAKNHMATTMDPLARWALIAETRLQNAWQNFREGKENLSNEEKGFAVQKAALPPVQFALTGDAKIDAPMKAFIETLTPEQRKGSLPEKSKEYSKYSLRAPNTPEFKRWFGNSKIVDENGNPKVMYHGTARDITEFKPKQANAIFLTEDADFTNFFASTSKTYMREELWNNSNHKKRIEWIKKATSQAKKDGSITSKEASRIISELNMIDDYGTIPYEIETEVWDLLNDQLPSYSNIMPVYVKAENPFDYENPKHVEQVLAKTDYSHNLNAERSVKQGSWSLIESPEFQEAIKALGFDSFYVKEQKVKNLAVYKSNQIKSAIGNIGTYDETNPDIRYSLRAPNTPAFKRWFSNSKVVDENGKPLVVYHGTSRTESDEAFTRFDTYGSNYGLMGMGSYFTADPAIASQYTSKGRGTAPTVYPAYLSIQNPLNMEAKADAKAWMKAFPDAESYHEGGDTNESWYRAAEEAMRDAQVPAYEGAEAMQQGIISMGYDGITHIGGGRVNKSDGTKHRVFVAFEPTQIKSAIGNVGTYDETNPNISYALRKKLPPVPINNAPPSYLTKLTNPQSTSQKIGNTFKEMKGTFNDNEWWTKKRAEWIDPSALITRHVQNKGVFDNGQLRADLLLRGASQTMNIVNNGLQSGLPELNTDNSIIIKRSEKNLARSQVLADILDANPFVRASGMSGRMYVQEVARSKRGEEIIAEDNKTIADGYQELAKAKQLLMQAKVAPNFTARTTLFKQSKAMRESGNKKIKTKRELQVTPTHITWADQQIKDVPELNEIFDIWRTNNNSLMSLWEDTGLVSNANSAYYRSKKHYVPLTMADEDIEELAGDNFGYAGPRGAKTAKELHVLKGADITRNLWENMYKNYAAKLSAAYENQTRKVAVEQLASVGAASISANPHKDANLINLRYKDWTNPLADKSGTVHAIVANPNDVLAFQNMHYELTPLMKFMSGVTKVLRTGALLNPMFWVRQLVRDPIHSTIVTDSGLVTPFHSAKEFINILRKNSREYDILFERGVVGPRDSTVDIHDFLSQVGEESSNKGLLSSAIRNVEKIHEASDAATRISVFKQAEAKALKELNMTPEDAINYATMKARESINFSVHGNSAMLNNLRHMIPFFSASITSLDTVYKASTGYGLPPQEKAAAKRLFQQRAAIMVILSTVYAMMMQGDDEYKKQPDYVKDNNWLIPNPFGTGFIKAPVPFEVGFLFKTIPETAVRYMAGTSTGKEVLASYQTGVLQNIPGGGLPIPQTFKPLLEVITNHSFFRNGPIETRADEDLPTYLRGEGKSSEVAKILSRFGLDSINLSPIKIDYLIQAYTAELGTFTTGLVDGVVKTAEGKSTPETPLEKMPFFKAFMTDPDADRAVGVFYDLTHNSKEVADAFNKLVREGHSKEAQEYLQEHRQEYVLHSPLDKIGREMAKIKKVINVIKNNESISPEERRARIDHLTSIYNKMAENGVAIARRINP